MDFLIELVKLVTAIVALVAVLRKEGLSKIADDSRVSEKEDR